MANIHTTLDSLFTAIANAIRSKNGSTETIVADTFPTEIENIKTRFDYNNQNVTTISDYAFYDCEDLNSVDCDSLTGVGASAFENCSNLQTIILYDDVTSIGENAVKGCDNVIIYYKGANIPETWHENWNPDNRPVLCGELIETWDVSATEEDNVTAELYASGLFIYGSGNMKNYSPYGAPWYSSYRKNITSITTDGSVTSIGNYAFYGCYGLTSITIPDSVTSIGEGAFHDCTNLTNVHIGNGVASISKNAFYHCYRLTSITIPDSVTSIGEGAFRDCTNLTNVHIGNGVASISERTFENCTNLTNVHIGNGVASIGNYTFYGCTNLASITVEENNEKYHSLGNCIIETSSKVLILGCKNSIIPTDGSVTSIGGDAFRDCTNLTSITIPDSVISIGYHAFGNCTNLTSITIPDSVISIGNYAFYGCTNLTNVHIGNGVASIGNEIFGLCVNLASITYSGTIEQWNSIDLGSDWNYNTGDYTIHCEDGDIAKDGTVTYH